MTKGNLTEIRQQPVTESMTVGELFRRCPVYGTVVFMTPDFSDPSRYREGNRFSFYIYDETSLPDGIKSMTVREISVRDADTLYIYCR